MTSADTSSPEQEWLYLFAVFSEQNDGAHGTPLTLLNTKALRGQEHLELLLILSFSRQNGTDCSLLFLNNDQCLWRKMVEKIRRMRADQCSCLQVISLPRILLCRIGCGAPCEVEASDGGGRGVHLRINKTILVCVLAISRVACTQNFLGDYTGHAVDGNTVAIRWGASVVSVQAVAEKMMKVRLQYYGLQSDEPSFMVAVNAETASLLSVQNDSLTLALRRRSKFILRHRAASLCMKTTGQLWLTAAANMR